MFFCISIVSLLIASVLITKLMSVLSLQIRLNRKRKYHFAMLLNQSIAAIVASFYLIGLFIADIRNVNFFFFGEEVIYAHVLISCCTHLLNALRFLK